MKVQTRSNKAATFSFVQPTSEPEFSQNELPGSQPVSAFVSVTEKADRVRVLEDVAVTLRSNDAVTFLEDSLLALNERRNQLIDRTDKLTLEEVLALEYIEHQMDDLEFQIYEHDRPKLRLEQSIQVLRQSEKEIEHCRNLLNQDHAKTRSNRKST